MLPLNMPLAMKRASAGRAARKPSLRIILLCVAVSALSQVLIVLVSSVFEMRIRIEFLPEVVIMACFLISYTTGWISSVRNVITTKSVIDKVAFDGGHKASPAAPTGEGASPKEFCRGSSKDSWDQVGNNWRLPSNMRTTHAQTEDVAPKVPKFAKAMHACIRLRQVDTALKLFDQMLEEGVGHDAHLIGKATADKFFNLVAENLDVKRMRNDGLSLFDVVQAHGLAPSTAIQNRVIIAWKSKPPKSVVKYLLTMKSSGHLISRLAYFSIMISSERSDPELVLRLCDEMEILGIKPDKVAYNSVLGACCQLGMYDEAGLLFAQMADRGLTPDVKTYHIMLHIKAQSKQFQEAIALFETMREQCLKPDRHDYHNAIHSCINLQRIEYAVELYHDMTPAKVMPHERTVCDLRSACQRYGLSTSAIQFMTRCKGVVMVDERSR
jgi:pentatricopeptide repeat protein